MHRCQDNSLVYYEFEQLASQVDLVHGVFTRLGGVSHGPFASLNLGRTVGDSEDAVRDNYARICRSLHIAEESLVTGYQVHSDRVAVVGPQDKGAVLPETDALVTDRAEIGLTLRFADCVPLLFFDPVRRAVGLAHAGWKGTVSQIGSRVVEVFKTEYGSQPSDVIACIGPSIGPCCYQVGDVVIQAIEESVLNPNDFLIPQRDKTIHLDLWAANRQQLEESGVKTIEESGLCTSCRRDEFFSHRGDNGTTGRFGAFVALLKR